MKIVTLIPSATEIVSFLGQKKSIIGRSHECDFPHDLSKIKTLTEPKINVDGTIELKLKGHSTSGSLNTFHSIELHANELNANIVLNDGKPINIKMLISLIDNSKFVVANDTGPAHIASHLNKKGLVLFGNHTSPEKVSIESKNFKALSAKKLSDLSVESVIHELKKNLN